MAKSLIKGIFLCTAWRVGNTNQMLTNHHCIGSAEDLAATEFTVGWDCATCGGADPVAGVKVGRGRFLKTSPRAGGLDYTLVTVNDFARIQRFGTLYLDVREPTLGEPIYIAGQGALLVAMAETIGLYRSAGYREVAAFNDEPYAHHCSRSPSTPAMGRLPDGEDRPWNTKSSAAGSPR